MRARARARSVLLLSALTAAATGCPATDVTVATEQPPLEAGVPDTGARTCAQSSDCIASDEYCQKTSCNAAEGVCQLLTDKCTDEEDFVCGCNGVFYWNDCYLQRDGQNAGPMGQCPHVRPCGGDLDPACPPGAVCGRVDRNPMGGDCMPPGTCWVVPDPCPDGTGGPMYQACAPELLSCASFCDALHTERPYTRPPGPCH